MIYIKEKIQIYRIYSVFNYPVYTYVKCLKILLSYTYIYMYLTEFYNL